MSYHPREAVMRTAREIVALGIVLVVVSFLPTALHSQPNFTEGMWEMKGEVKFEGEIKIEGRRYPMKPVAIHYTKCLTKKDMVPHKQDKNEKCTKVSEKTSGNRLTWVMKCTSANGTVIDSTGSAVFSSTTFDAKGSSVLTDSKGEKSKATMTMKGHRTGPCK
jgi:hypothetical protein